MNVLRIDKKIEIKNPTVKKMLMETKNHGPYYTHCPSCHNKNLNFFQHLKENEAVKILSFIQKDISASQEKTFFLNLKNQRNFNK